MSTSRIIIELLVRDRRFRNNLDQSRRGLAGLRGEALSAGSVLRGLGSIVGTVGIVRLATDTGKVIARFQDFRSNLRFLSGSARDYASNQEFLARTAQDYSAKLNTVRASSARLLALEKVGVLTRREDRQVLTGLIDAARVLGLSNEQLELVFYGLGQALTQGMVQAQEFNQIIEPMPGLLQQLDQAAGLPANGFRRLVLQGAVTSGLFKRTLIQALQSYVGASQAAASNLGPTWNRLANEYQLLQESLDQPISEVAIPGIEGIRRAIENLRRSNSLGAGFDFLRAETELWIDTTNEGLRTIRQALSDAFGPEIRQELSLLVRAAVEFPANISAGFSIIIGEGDKALIRLSAFWDEFKAVASTRLQLVAISFEELWTEVRQGASRFLDGLKRDLADAFARIQEGLAIIPGFDGLAEGVGEIAQSLRDSATGAQEAGQRLRELAQQRLQALTDLQAEQQAIQANAQTQLQAADEAIQLALRERDQRLQTLAARQQELEIARQATEATRQQDTANREEANSAKSSAVAKELALQREVVLRGEVAKIARETAATVADVQRRGLSEGAQQASLEREANLLLAQSYLELAKAQRSTGKDRENALAAADAYAKRAESLGQQIDQERVAVGIIETAGRRRAAVAVEEKKEIQDRNKEANKDIKPRVRLIDGEIVAKALDGLIDKIEVLKKGATVPLSFVQNGGVGSVPGFASGGTIPGGFGGGDRVPILAESGEEMITKRRARLTRPLLKFINNAPTASVRRFFETFSAQRLAAGGTVGGFTFRTPSLRGYETGGTVGGMDTVRILMDIPGRGQREVYAPRATARDLADDLAWLARGRVRPA